MTRLMNVPSLVPSGCPQSRQSHESRTPHRVYTGLADDGRPDRRHWRAERVRAAPGPAAQPGRAGGGVVHGVGRVAHRAGRVRHRRRVGCGAALASAMWFAALGYGAAALSPWLRRPAVWRAIDGIVAVVMALVALQLIF